MTSIIAHAETDDEIAATFEIMRQLRPHLVREDYVATIRRLMASDGLRLIALRDDGDVRAAATYWVMRMLYCGSCLYVDDLVCDERARSHGHGAAMIAKLKDIGAGLGCSEIQLISRVVRERAHRFYFRQGFGIECFHFRAPLA